MWLSLARFLPIAKPFLLVLSFASIGIGAHFGIKSWFHHHILAAEERGRSDCREAQLRQQLKEVSGEKDSEIARLKGELDRQSATFTKMRDEVNWARDHVQKQQSRIRELKENSDKGLADCLALPVDTDILR